MADSDSSPSLHIGDKANKVFAVPELLENILGFLVRGEMETGPLQGDGVRTPARSLYRLLRVNRTFHNTITTSPILQRAMFLRSPDLPTVQAAQTHIGPHLCAYSGRLSWFLSTVAYARGGENNFFIDIDFDETPSGTIILKVDFAIEDHLDAFERFIKDFDTPSASWRKIEICPVPGLTLRVVGYVKLRAGMRYPFEWEFKNGMMLEAVLTRYRKVMDGVRAYRLKLAEIEDELSDTITNA